MSVDYSRVNWQQAPSTSTPINATNLNKMDKGIADAVNQANTNETAINTLNSDLNTQKNRINSFGEQYRSYYLGSGVTTISLPMNVNTGALIHYYVLGSNGINGSFVRSVGLRVGSDGTCSITPADGSASANPTATFSNGIVTIDFSNITIYGFIRARILTI